MIVDGNTVITWKVVTTGLVEHCVLDDQSITLCGVKFNPSIVWVGIYEYFPRCKICLSRINRLLKPMRQKEMRKCIEKLDQMLPGNFTPLSEFDPALKSEPRGKLKIVDDGNLKQKKGA